MELTHYLTRIRYEGPTNVSYETLRAIHRAHLLNITYENLDIHRGLSLPLDEVYFYQKIVEQGRGGWCYEMNGLLAWALREMGFSVTLLAGSVNRPVLGDSAEGNHLCLVVESDQPYLADVGFGNGILEPLPLVAGIHHQRGFTYHLHQEGEYWHFTNHPEMGPGFDFTLHPYALKDFAARCHYLQTSPDSGFVRVTVCHHQTTHGFVSLKGATLRTVTPESSHERIIENQSDYESTLLHQFDITLPDSGAIWQKVWQDHQVWVQSLSGN
jgi:N-hydroxyarylamine O-acetyltransferase